MKRTILASLLFASNNLYAFEQGLEAVQKRCADLEKGSVSEIAFLDEKELKLMPLSQETCLFLNGRFSGAYYESEGKLYTSVLFNLDCTQSSKPSRLEISTKKKKLVYDFDKSDIKEDLKTKELIIKTDSLLGRIDWSSEVLKKMYFRTSTGEAFILNILKDKVPMPVPNIEK